MEKELIRHTAFGKEYWDAEAKRTVFIANAYADDKPVAVGVDFASGKDMTVVTDIEDEPVNDTDTDEIEPIDVNLDEMNANELRAFAKENGIELHFSIKKEETIRAKIKEALAVDDAQ